MTLTFTLAEAQGLAEQTRAHHHEHFQGVVADGPDRVRFVFGPFTGQETPPYQPFPVHSDESLSPAARALLMEEYRQAERLWRTAQYVRLLKQATSGAAAAWAAYTAARAEMDVRFTALDTTPDGAWRSAVHRLVTAQETVRAAARAWDKIAARIATVHDHRQKSAGISRDEAYTRAGLDPVGSGWLIGNAADYRTPWREDTPLLGQAAEAIDTQRTRLRTVTTLCGSTGAVGQSS